METPVAIVTAASQGIGAAVARELGKRGYRLALMSRGDGIDAIAKELDAIAIRGDVRDTTAVESLRDAAIARFGRIDVAVANTGHPPKGTPLEITDESWLAGHELILGSAIRLARAIAPGMIEKRRGSLVFISSFAAVRPDVTRSTSSVYRAALGTYVQLLAEQLAPHGVRANAVLPGYVDSQPVAPAIVATIPLGRSGGVDELAKSVAYLASDDASFVTGQSLLVDGGMVR